MALLALGIPFMLAAAPVSGPVKVWVRLKDKGPAKEASGHEALGSLVSDQAGMGYEDRPVYLPYVEALRASGLSCDTKLKWQNLVSGSIDPSLLARVRALPFVTEVSRFPRKAKPDPALPRFPLDWHVHGLGKSAAGIDYGSGRALMESLQVDRVHAWMAGKGLPPGKGLRIAVIDADFHLGAPFYNDLFSQGRIRDQWDFVSNKPQSVDRELASSHGGECLSLIGGNLPGTLVGVAPEAEFLLYRSEDDDNETFVEEDYVAAAIERAVDSGAQVISISLGYRYEYTDGQQDLAYAEFDGRTRPSSIAATGAARRNVVVSVAMGNLPGASHIPFTPSIGAPADADSILAVGIADASRRKCSYSCTGPSADGRVKPDVASLGLGPSCTINVANTSSSAAALDQFAGTSFAAPVVAGIAALLRQAQPDLKAEDIRQSLITTAGQVLHPDGALGYGVVDAWAALAKIEGSSLAPLSSAGWVRLYHGGGTLPLFIPWEPGRPLPAFALLDLNGRSIAVTLRLTGPTLQIQPEHDLRTGVYLARIR